MACREERRRRNIDIFPDFSTLREAILAKSALFAEKWGDVGIASISDRNDLGKAISLPGGHFRPICSPFRRLEGAVNRS